MLFIYSYYDHSNCNSRHNYLDSSCVSYEHSHDCLCSAEDPESEVIRGFSVQCYPPHCHNSLFSADAQTSSVSKLPHLVIIICVCIYYYSNGVYYLYLHWFVQLSLLSCLGESSSRATPLPNGRLAVEPLGYGRLAEELLASGRLHGGRSSSPV